MRHMSTQRFGRIVALLGCAAASAVGAGQARAQRPGDTSLVRRLHLDSIVRSVQIWSAAT